ncbi:MAG: response regulator [Patescibacteria group bacterium]
MSKLLLVEDDQVLADLYRTRFEADGFVVVRAEDGEQALELASAEKPDIILLDIMIPKLDGFAVLEQLKKNKALHKIPVIITSNLGQPEDMARGKALGAVDYFVKADQTPNQMSERVKEILKHKS